MVALHYAQVQVDLTAVQSNLTSARVVCHERRLSTTVRNSTRDEGGPFEVGNQVLISSHRKLLSSKPMVVSVARISRGFVENGLQRIETDFETREGSLRH
jgi:hypothetical protein